MNRNTLQTARNYTQGSLLGDKSSILGSKRSHIRLKQLVVTALKSFKAFLTRQLRKTKENSVHKIHYLEKAPGSSRSHFHFLSALIRGKDTLQYFPHLQALHPHINPTSTKTHIYRPLGAGGGGGGNKNPPPPTPAPANPPTGSTFAGVRLFCPPILILRVSPGLREKSRPGGGAWGEIVEEEEVEEGLEMGAGF